MGDGCLVIIDAQLAFHTFETDHTYSALSRFLEERKDVYQKIIATRYVNNKNTACAKLLDWHGCVLSSGGVNLESFVQRVATDIIDKSTYAAGDALYPYLQYFINTEIHICGFNTEACVLATAMSLFDRCVDFKVVSDLCNTTKGQAANKAALDVMRTAFGKERVTTTADLNLV